MSEDIEQIARIRKMERRLDRALAAQEAIATLDKYYGSDLWRKDFEDDEAGLLPADLKRGVLSEDGIWNLLTDCKDLKERLKKSGK